MSWQPSPSHSLTPGQATILSHRSALEKFPVGLIVVIARSEATNQSSLLGRPWIASRSLSSGGHFGRTRWLAITVNLIEDLSGTP